MINNLLKNIKLNNMNGYFVSNKKELLILLDELICDDSSVGVGDSLTLEQLEVFNYLKMRKIKYYDKHQENLSKEMKRKIYLSNFDADYFISGSNAISVTGEIFNIDGNGSRVAPMIYGPKKVVIIIGTNKICPDQEAAQYRIRNIAAPLDVIRLNKKTPCKEHGSCVNCKSKERICNSFVTIAHQFDNKRIHIIIVEGNYGF